MGRSKSKIGVTGKAEHGQDADTNLDADSNLDAACDIIKIHRCILKVGHILVTVLS